MSSNLTKEEKVLKHQATIEKYKQYVANERSRSDRYLGVAKSLGDMIPMGQPILVGHHSEGYHRRHIGRMNSNMEKGLEELKKAEYYERKIKWHELQIKRLNKAVPTASEKRSVWEEQFRSKYNVGDKVKCWLRSHVNNGECEIIKMNTKTARIRFSDGVEWTQNISLLAHL